MLVLLIIFMVITPMLTKGVSVDMVKTKNPIAMQAADKEDAVLVAVTRDGKVYLSPGNYADAADRAAAEGEGPARPTARTRRYTSRRRARQVRKGGGSRGQPARGRRRSDRAADRAESRRRSKRSQAAAGRSSSSENDKGDTIWQWQWVARQGRKCDINMTPLIDVLLVLLIIFMVITPLTPQGLEALVPQPPPPSPTSRRTSGPRPWSSSIDKDKS